MELRTALRDEPGEVGRARHLIGTSLSRWGVPDADGVAELLVSELVTNALRYGCQPMRLVARHGPGALRIEIHDGEFDDSPIVKQVTPDSTRGRGMLLVDTLAARWGYAENWRGKHVWFELDL